MILQIHPVRFINCPKSIAILSGAIFSHPSTPLSVLLKSSSLSGVEGCGEHVDTFGTINISYRY